MSEYEHNLEYAMKECEKYDKPEVVITNHTNSRTYSVSLGEFRREFIREKDAELFAEILEREMENQNHPEPEPEPKRTRLDVAKRKIEQSKK